MKVHNLMPTKHKNPKNTHRFEGASERQAGWSRGAGGQPHHHALLLLSTVQGALQRSRVDQTTRETADSTERGAALVCHTSSPHHPLPIANQSLRSANHSCTVCHVCLSRSLSVPFSSTSLCISLSLCWLFLVPTAYGACIYRLLLFTWYLIPTKNVPKNLPGKKRRQRPRRR